MFQEKLLGIGSQERVERDAFDQRVRHVMFPLDRAVDEGDRPRIAAVIEPAVQVPPERLAALGPGPVRAAVEEKSSGETLGKPALQQQGRRSEQNYSAIEYFYSTIEY
jgi:hypothetical protein